MTGGGVSVRRVMGIETEYGIVGSGALAGVDPEVLSAAVIRAEPFGIRSVPAYAGDPHCTNRWLPNGARFYLDHGHPEYATPEVTSPLAAVMYDEAGRSLIAEAAREAGVALFKNNVDGKGQSYGCHENYQVARAVPFETLVAVLVPFLVTRQVFAGAGRVWIGPRGEQPGFQMSQRADYLERVTGLATTGRRAIVNTRDEPHADPLLWRRLHLIVGDANLLQPATFLKLATTALVLGLAERGDPDVLARLAALELADPVGDVRRVSRDLTCTTRLELQDGRRLTAIEIQREYLDAVEGLDSTPIRSKEFAVPKQTGGGVEAGDGGGLVSIPDSDAQTAMALVRWRSVLDRLAEDPALCARDVEWVAKHRLIVARRRRDNLPWDHPVCAAMDLQWHIVDPHAGLALRLAAAGAVETMPPTPVVGMEAMTTPPKDTRAHTRGTLVATQPDSILAMDWDYAVLTDGPGKPPRRLDLASPLTGG